MSASGRAILSGLACRTRRLPSEFFVNSLVSCFSVEDTYLREFFLLPKSLV